MSEIANRIFGRHVDTFNAATKANRQAAVIFEIDGITNKRGLEALEAKHIVVRFKPEAPPFVFRSDDDFVEPPIRVEKWRWFPFVVTVLTLRFAILRAIDEHDLGKRLVYIWGILLLLPIAWGELS
ncbi:unnamed protein product, partial [Mesorhabditis spiculigera]